MASDLTLSVQGAGSSEGDSISFSGTSASVGNKYNRFVVNGSSALVLDMATPPVPMGTVITAVYIELHSGAVDVTFSSTVGADKVTLSAASGKCVFTVSPVELPYLAVTPTMFSNVEISVMTR